MTMDFEYSPHRSAGGTMHLLSPTHSQYGVDAFPSIKQLRRSLSRSPSKPQRFQIHATKSPNKSPNSPRSPSALSRAFSANAATDTGAKSKFTLRRNPARGTPRKPSPNSALRRALSDGLSQANTASAAPHRRSSTEEQENSRSVLDTAKEMRFELDNEPIKFDLLKARADRSNLNLANAMREQGAPAKSSPLKRSDGVMNLDQATLGSPRAKRRSLHNGPLGIDIDIFDQGLDGAHGDREHDDKLNQSLFSTSAPQRSPRRPFYLRKSTIQQRASTGSSKPKLFADAAGSAQPSPAKASRPRASLESTLPFRSLEPPVFPPPHNQKPFHSAPKPHPLSKALSPSSSASSFTDEPGTAGAPPKAPAPSVAPKVSEAPRPPMVNFSRSLPIGALRPSAAVQAESSHGSSDGSFETPEAYKMAKPLPAAFMSTGLISKRNRNIEEAPANLFASVNMPDTPSKKTTAPHIGATPAPASGLGKLGHSRHEFGSPSTPFSPHAVKASPESFGKGVSIFGSRVGLTRRSSFLSIDGEDISQSPTGHLDTQLSTDELPPTPTKPAQSVGVIRPMSKGKGNSLRSSLFGRRTSLAPDTFAPPSADQEQEQRVGDCKYPSVTTSPVNRNGRSIVDGGNPTAPSITFTGCGSPTSSPSFTRSRVLRRLSAKPAPLDTSSMKSPSVYIPNEQNAESDMQTAVCTEMSEESGPHTPNEIESFTPPDPSSLSISADHHGSLNFNGSNSFPPATPTGPREHGFSFGVSHGPGASMSGHFQNEVDTTLTARFGSVHTYGVGTFSQVYRVEKPLPGGLAGPKQPKRPAIGNVWAVKKSKKPYTGNKDRQRKMREVDILMTLRGSEHIIELVDTWESKGHLYIQTEFCENGNLKDFLSQTGFKGRLDDFRIWKILLELSQGVKSIHDAGFIHLDLKPANIFIDWEGVLKIGDFGMATAWPAPSDLDDGEGDRLYIGPEILKGRFDKPADIFSLGMTMLEIAGNIVLPDYGASWQKLRAGDLSDLPELTFSSESSLARDESGDPVAMSGSDDTFCIDDDLSFTPRASSNAHRMHELVKPPQFMVDPNDPEALDKVVQWMIAPDPDERPVVDQVLACGGVQWVESRRRAGATVYEGNWGPADDVLGAAQDVEMLDI